jgi:cytochrome b561
VSAGGRHFDGAERLVHWVHAALFGGLVGTGALLVWSPASRAIAWDGVRLVPLLHVALGVALLVAPFAPALAGRGAALASDVGDWLAWGRHPRFNVGQRLNALWTIVTTLALGGTGLLIWSGRAVPIRLRESAYEWHVFLALLVVVVAVGHVVVALAHPASMRAILGLGQGASPCPTVDEPGPGC